MKPSVPFVPSGFFALRTPYLPFEELEAWSAGLTGAEAPDRELLRQRLGELIDRPEIREAVFVASPSLYDGLALWRREPEGKKGQRAERALVRYLLRMAGRPTPFGLFSGCSLGTTGGAGEPSRLRLTGQAGYQRHTRLDMDYLFALVEALVRDPGLRRELVFRPNNSLYRAAGKLRYAEARLNGKAREHHLVGIAPDAYLEEALRRAADGVRPADLARCLVELDPDGEVLLEEAEAYVGELIASQVLVPDLALPITGVEPVHEIVRRLTPLAAAAGVAAEAASRLARAQSAIDAIDAGASQEAGSDETEPYRAIARDLAALPTEVELSRLFQVDLVKPGEELRLGPAVIAELERGLQLLHRLYGRLYQEPLDRFRSSFSERYGDGRWMPLLAVLDEEAGIGFERSESPTAEASPLLRGLALGAPPAAAGTPWSRRQAVLLHWLSEALLQGRQEIELSDADLEKLNERGDKEPPPLPDALQVMASLAADSEEALDQGRFRLYWKGSGGPSGARLLGRFCHADPVLNQAVIDHLAAEEAHRPEAIFAEIVHLPQGRIGNILLRPVLRRYEIPYLGASGVPPEDQIPLADLQVTSRGGRIVLRSVRLDREVIPRLTSAHNYVTGSLGVYRFLCSLQSQGVCPGLSWSWGALDAAPFLPRVRSGRLVLSRATWRMTEAEIQGLVKPKPEEKRPPFAAVADWRRERRLPRWAALADGDNELLIDFDNPLAVDTFLDVIEGRNQALLCEHFPDSGELCVRGPEGRFVQEIVVPFVRVPAEAPALPAPRPRPAPPAPGASERTFAPGSAWLYCKLYTGKATADVVLREVVAPAVHRALADGAATSWFFIRYGDPDWHLRVRLQGDPRVLHERARPLLEQAAAPLLATGLIAKVQFDTYERETERYGGPHGIGLAEQLFAADSEAVLALVDALEGDEGAEARWKLCLTGIDRLLTDLGFDAPAKLQLLDGMRRGFAQEFEVGKPLRVQLDRKFREARPEFAGLLAPEWSEEHPLSPGFEIFRQRSEQLAPIAAELRGREAAGELTATLAEMAPSYVHMHVNRLIRSAARAHELVLYDLLYQEYAARAARERKGR